MGDVILIVDDEDLVLSVAALLLTREGFEVLTAESGPCALAVFGRRPDSIACVILDLSMPVMSGMEVLERMRAIRADIPVIVSTGYSEQPLDMFEHCANVVAVLRKPYDGLQLLATVHAALKAIRPESQ